jgi:hypothetical protein
MAKKRKKAAKKREAKRHEVKVHLQTAEAVALLKEVLAHLEGQGGRDLPIAQKVREVIEPPAESAR